MNQTVQTIPVLAVRNLVVFPGATVSVNVGRDSSVLALEAAAEIKGPILVLAQKEDQAEFTTDDLHQVGVLCSIEKLFGSSGKGYQVLLRGEDVVTVKDFSVESDGLLTASYVPRPDATTLDEATERALVSSLKQLAFDILKLIPGNTDQARKLVAGIDELRLLVGICVDSLDVELSSKQRILEQEDPKERTLSLLQAMQRYKDQLKIQHDISRRLNDKLGKRQRDVILREQLSAIKEELGDEAGDNGLWQKIREAGMPEEVEAIAVEELKKLESTPNASPESQVIRNYLDLLIQLPWEAEATPAIDLGKARSQLEEDHYGLDKIKDRIVQHLAVMKLKSNSSGGSVLILTGPPGVGKTSIAKSIAKALGRKFVRASLGGVRDDAEIRGHRRTYIGAMPGKIIQSLKRSQSKNPVFLLDEIDKMGRGFQGDPGSALLEVLDPEQNTSFTDHYLDVPYDLSDVFFIATANSLDSIPAPLLDRMEIIQVSGYTFGEKLHIAKNHLLARQAKDLGIEPKIVRFSDEAMLRLISGYTREAGVRSLQRQIATVLRASTEKVLELKPDEKLKIGCRDVTRILGPPKFQQEVAGRLVPPGVVTGLAWTPVGGEILFIEAKAMKGSGKLTITGQLGDVMRESAQIAMSIVRSHLSQVPGGGSGINFDSHDIHIHVPSGAIPKDGPSAGIAMLSTLASLFTGKVVDPHLAMTGELTLRGAVMPVGGIKEKVLAAHRAGITKVLLPKQNQPDLRDIPKEVKSALDITFVETAEQVLKEVLQFELPPALLLPEIGSTEEYPALN